MRIAALFALIPACSWAFVDPPPLYVAAETASVSCTRSVATPIADTVIAAAMFTAAGVMLAASRHNNNNGLPTGGQSYSLILAIPAFLIGVPHTVSAIYGYTKTAHCRDLNRAAAARNAR